MNTLLHSDIRLPEDNWGRSLPKLAAFYAEDFMPPGQSFFDYLPLAADFVLPITREGLVERGFSSGAVDFALEYVKGFPSNRMWLLLENAKELPFYTEGYTGKMQIPQLILSDVSGKRFTSNNESISQALEYLEGCDREDPEKAFRYAITVWNLNLRKVRHQGETLKKLLLSAPVLYFKEQEKAPRLLSPEKAKHLAAYLTDLKYCETETGCFAELSRPLGELIAVSPNTFQALVMHLTEDSLIFHRFGRLRFLDLKEAVNLFF